MMPPRKQMMALREGDSFRLGSFDCRDEAFFLLVVVRLAAAGVLVFLCASTTSNSDTSSSEPRRLTNICTYAYTT